MKRGIAILTVCVLALACLAGCATAPEEETAAVGEYVAGDSSENRPADESAPVKVENQEGGTVTEHRNNSAGTAQSGESAGGESGAQQSETPAPSGNGETAQSKEDTPAGATDTEEEQSGGNVEYNPQNKLKIVSYNLRVGNDGSGLDIADRAPRLKIVMDQYDPDIMGFQEVVPEWMDNYLIPYFSVNYDYILQYRSATSNEGTPLFWKKDRFTCLESGHFWLSPTPDQLGSKGWGATYPRVCSWAKLKVKATGKEFLFYNTHFDFTSDAHVNSAKLIAQRAKGKGGFTKFAVFATADFNMIPWSNGYIQMLAEFNDVNDVTVQSNQYTGHGYKDSGNIIDYVFCSRELCYPITYKVLTEKPGGQFVSDHFGLYTEVALL